MLDGIRVGLLINGIKALANIMLMKSVIGLCELFFIKSILKSPIIQQCLLFILSLSNISFSKDIKVLTLLFGGRYTIPIFSFAELHFQLYMLFIGADYF